MRKGTEILFQQKGIWIKAYHSNCNFLGVNIKYDKNTFNPFPFFIANIYLCEEPIVSTVSAFGLADRIPWDVWRNHKQ